MAFFHRLRIDRDSDAELSLVVASTQGEAEAEQQKIADRALRAGHTVTWPDGRRQWVSREPVWNSDEHDYEWHTDGNRVRVRRVLVTRIGSRLERKTLSVGWVSYDRVIQ